MRRVKLALFICVSVGGLLLGFGFADFSSYMTTINGSLMNGNDMVVNEGGNVKKLIENYCDAITQNDISFTQNTFTYSAKQSVFVYLLCSNVHGYKSPLVGFEKGETKYFKLTTFSDLGLTDRNLVFKDLCNPDRDMNTCDLSKILPKLYNMIINDYVNLKQPNLYGLTTVSSDDKKLNDEANVFSTANFNLLICDDGATPSDYPKSCKLMKKYLKDANKLLADVKIFNKDKLYEGKSASYCDTTKDTYQLLLCGINGDATTSLEHFLNLMYNELFYYRLFVSYYSLMIRAHASTILGISPTAVNDELYDRITTLNDEVTWSQQAVSMTLRMLRDLYAAFPLHIGFLMYQEHLQGFGEHLAHIMTPMYTLYDKLRNVQKP